MNATHCSHDVNNASDALENKKMAEHAHCVSIVPIFNHLQTEELAFIANKAIMRKYERGELIYRSGDLSDQLFIVQKGKAKVYRLSKEGREQLVRILLPGDFAGELALFSAVENDSYAEALDTTHICTIKRHDVQELLEKYPAISLHILSELARRLDTSEKQTAIISSEPVNARIGKYLLALANQTGKNSFNLPMSRKNMASFLGTSPETVSRKLRDFEEAGWILQNGPRKITILDADALRV